MTATNRRDLLARVACASAAGVLAAPAPLAATEVDPHVAWGAEWRALLDYCNGPGPWEADLEDTPEGQRMYELQDLIAQTPATTLAGVSAQFEVVLEFEDPHPDEDAGTLVLKALRNMRDTLQRLAGAGVVA